MSVIRESEWRAKQQPTKFPFADFATLSNGEVSIENSMLLDASLFPVGSVGQLYLSRAEVSSDKIKLWLGDSQTAELAFTEFDLVDVPDLVSFEDTYGRPAGVFVSKSTKLASIRTFGVGTHEFLPAQTAFVSDVCMPTPEVGLRGFIIDNEIVTGNVILVGENGIVFEHQSETKKILPLSDVTTSSEVLVFNVVGDPLFFKTLCGDEDNYVVPSFIRSITFSDAQGNSFTCEPDKYGNVQFAVANNEAEDTVLRIKVTQEGLQLEAVGEPLQGVIV